MRHLWLWTLPILVAAAPRPPAEFLGHEVGADRELADWTQICAYLAELDAASDRLDLQELGRSTLDRPFLVAYVADAQGLEEREQIRAQIRQLYDVANTDETQARMIAAAARPVLVFSLGLHSSEVAASQASMQMLYELVTREDQLFQSIRRELLVLIVPSMNPDGLDIVVDWYRETKGSAAEGTMPPWLYHHYAGHDNNRDGFFNNLAETALFSQLIYQDWLPQIVIDEHQMGNGGPRLFLPPFDDPISPSVHPLVYSQLAAVGQQVVSDLTALGHRGIVTESIFTGEWPGSVRSTGFWHNMLGILSEAASARLASPLYFPSGSLSGSGRGLPAYERRTNFLDPWPGGWWRLGDIVKLELDLTWAILRWSVQHDEDLLFNFWQMNRDAVDRGKNEAPFGFAFAADQFDASAAARLAELLRAGGVQVEFMPDRVVIENRHFPNGAYFVSCAQPFRPFILELLDSPPYPMIAEGENAPVIRPYDVTAWHLPSLLGVEVVPLPQGDVVDSVAGTARPIELPSTARVAFSARNNASYRIVNQLLAAGIPVRRLAQARDGRNAGDFLVEADAQRVEEISPGSAVLSQPLDCSECWDEAPAFSVPRIGLYSPWGGSMDEGWTRLVFDRFAFAHETLRLEDLRDKKASDGGKLAKRLPVLVFASIDAKTLREGEQGEAGSLHEPRWPERYQGGLSGPGNKDFLLAYLGAGGRIIALDASTDWLIEELGLPVQVELQDLDRGRFYAPGTLVRAQLDLSSPFNWGSPAELAVYFAGGRAFRPRAWSEPTAVLARYAEADLRVAGFLVGEREMAGKPCWLAVPVGKGQVVLFGFSPQHRAQTEATFKLLFASILAAG